MKTRSLIPTLIVVIFATLLSFTSGGLTRSVAATQTRSIRNLGSPLAAYRAIGRIYSGAISRHKCPIERYRRPRLSG